MARELLYKRAETEMRRRITDGDWAVGTRLGNEFELAEEFEVRSRARCAARSCRWRQMGF